MNAPCSALLAVLLLTAPAQAFLGFGKSVKYNRELDRDQRKWVSKNVKVLRVYLYAGADAEGFQPDVYQALSGRGYEVRFEDEPLHSVEKVDTNVSWIKSNVQTVPEGVLSPGEAYLFVTIQGYTSEHTHTHTHTSSTEIATVEGDGGKVKISGPVTQTTTSTHPSGDAVVFADLYISQRPSRVQDIEVHLEGASPKFRKAIDKMADTLPRRKG